MTTPSAALWFATRPGTFFVYRVNRRPWRDQNLFTPAVPRDVFDHFVRMLAPGFEVITGRRSQRVWRVGGLQADPEQRTLVGKLGWEPRGQEAVAQWSDDQKDWISATASPHGGRVVPFGFDGETRLLTVLRDSRTTPTTTAAVFERILNENEQELENPSTEWAVEPVLDVADFIEWLETLDTVQVVSFTAKLPNPEPRDRFKDLAGRLQALHATSYTETLRSDRDEGLVSVGSDHEIRQAIAMGEQGFAQLRGEGRVGDSISQYSQSNRVAKEHVEELPESWDAVWAMVTDFLKGRLRRFLDQEEPRDGV